MKYKLHLKDHTRDKIMYFNALSPFQINFTVVWTNNDHDLYKYVYDLYKYVYYILCNAYAACSKENLKFLQW